MRRLNEKGIYLLSFIITLVAMLIVMSFIKDIIFTFIIMTAILGFCFIILSSLKFGGRK